MLQYSKIAFELHVGGMITDITWLLPDNTTTRQFTLRLEEIGRLLGNSFPCRPSAPIYRG
jgi:hypothetical protein